MTDTEATSASARTVLEQKIRQRQETFEEFTAYAEAFAREHNEPGTLSVRHLQRLVAGARPDGRPLGSVRPATERLLERIFDMHIDELLANPQQALTGHPLRVAIAIVVRDEEVLIVCRRGEDTSGITWQFPAGVVKPNSASNIVAVQETLAETGVHCVVSRTLGSRIHPLTNVVCNYVLCDYIAGSARNLDVVENVDVVWAHIADLTRFIPTNRIHKPVLDALDLKNTRNDLFASRAR